MCEAPAEAPAVPYDQVSAGGSGSLCEPQRGDNVVIYNSPTTSFCVTLGLSIKFIAVGEAQDDIDIEQGTDSVPADSYEQAWINMSQTASAESNICPFGRVVDPPVRSCAIKEACLIQGDRRGGTQSELLPFRMAWRMIDTGSCC